MKAVVWERKTCGMTRRASGGERMGPSLKETLKALKKKGLRSRSKRGGKGMEDLTPDGKMRVVVPGEDFVVWRWSSGKARFSCKSEVVEKML